MCDSCLAKNSCIAGPTGQKVKVTAKNPLGAKNGDRVVISISSKKLITLSVTIYILPLMFLFIGAVLGPGLTTILGISFDYDSASAFFAVLFFVIAFLSVALYMRRFKPGGEISPEITEIYL